MTDLDEARVLLPWWVVWGPALVGVPLAFGLARGAARAATWWALRGLPGPAEPWPERARHAHCGRAVVGFLARALPAAALGAVLLGGGELCPVPVPLLALGAGLAAFLGVALEGRRLGRRLGEPAAPWGVWVRQTATAALLLTPATATLLLIVPFVPPRFDLPAGLVLAAGGLLLGFVSCDGGLLLARAVGAVRPGPTRLRTATERAARRADLPARPADLVDLPLVNAYAFPVARRLVVTDRLLALLDDDALEEILVHELAHLTEPRGVLVARIAPTLLLLPWLAALPLLHAVGPAPVLVLLLLGRMLARTFGQVGRELETRADLLSAGAEAQSGAYARSLLLTHEAALTPVVWAGGGTTHPHLYDRLLDAGLPPPFPRPAPPPTSATAGGVVLGLLPVAVLAGILVAPAGLLARAGEWTVGLRNGRAADLAEQAARREANGDDAGAAALYAAASATDPAEGEYPLRRAEALWSLGREAEAREALREAARRGR